MLDATSSQHDRPHRQRWPEDQLLAHSNDQAGKDFERLVVDAFLAVLEDVREEQPWVDEAQIGKGSAIATFCTQEKWGLANRGGPVN
jgi:HD-GYP domain-containing protein (c-di-GMP phosphodiesterase class II)